MPPSQRLRARFQPRLEFLEARLPPGDLLLGVAMTLSSVGADLPVGPEVPVALGRPRGLGWDDTANRSILARNRGPAGARAGAVVHFGRSPTASRRIATMP